MNVVITPQRVEFEHFQVGDFFFNSGQFWFKHEYNKATVVLGNKKDTVEEFDYSKLVNIVVSREIIKLLDASTKSIY